MKNAVLFLILLCPALIFAQYTVKPTYFEVTGVSNQGMVAGYEQMGCPFSLWNPEENMLLDIGGAAPGNGVGGEARFSANGNYLSGTNYASIPVNMDWHKYQLTDFNYIFKSLEFPSAGNGFVGYAGGQSITYMGDGTIIKTNDGGNTWSQMWVDEDSRGIEAMSFPTDVTGYVCGWSGYFAKTVDGGWSWTEQDPAGNADVFYYTGVAFKDELNGVVTAQLNNGMGVYVTSDGGETWTPGTGLTSIPSKVIYVSGDTYYLVNSGQMQKSTNNGLTWSTVHTFPGSLLMGLSFYSDMIGILLGEDNIYKTHDGGLTWTPQAVGPEVLWHDAAWIDEDHIIICGTPDMIYESEDGGATWSWANDSLSTFDPALYDIAVTSNKAHVSGSQGTFYKRSTVSSQVVAEMARYNMSTSQWQQLGSLGVVLDNTVSAGWNISGSGNTIVGNAWAEAGSAHAVAWNATEGLIDLGSMFTGASTRANAVSSNGNVIAGWQDFNGPWKATIWRKNPAGGYFPNQYLLINPNGSATDEFNQLGMAQAVSSDGMWVGGQGDYANNGDPWIWSDSTGYVSLGHMENGTGMVTGINEDGTLAVGFFDMGMWDPRVPFIWTPSSGLLNLNTFITQNLGYDMGTSVIYTPWVLSQNGRYVAGTGYDSAIGPWGEYIAFRLELPATSTDESVQTAPPAVLKAAYPNPFNPETHLSFSISRTSHVTLKIFNTRGQLVRTLVNDMMTAGDHTVVWNGKDDHGNAVASGMYLYRMQVGSFTATKKMMMVK